MEFKKITINDKPIIDKYLKSANLGVAEHCFTDLFMWQDYYSTCFYEDGEFLYIKSKSVEDGTDYYMCPVGTGDLKQALDKLFINFGDDISVISVTEEIKEKIENIMPNVFDYSEIPESADYIYLSEKLISLAGKKLHSKRNFVNRFIAEYGEKFVYEKMTNENKNKAWEFHQTWNKETGNEEEDKSLRAETLAIKRIMDNFNELGVIGATFYVDNKVVGYTIATKSTENLAVVQIEKGDINYNGVYQMINKTFVENELADVVYINREEDMGIEGLRKAKLSYRPEIIRMKYCLKRRK